MLELNTIDVDITGFSFLNPIARKIAEWIVDYFNNFIIKEVAEEYARNFLNRALSDNLSLHRLFGYAITGMVLESSKESSESNGLTGVDNLQMNRSLDEHPVAPLRQRRKTSNSATDRQNNLSGSYASLDRQNYTTAPPPSRPNNAQRQHSVPRLQMNGSASRLLPEDTVRNNLTGKRNEIIINPNKMFSTKSSGKLEVKYIPMKPPML